MSHGTVPPNTMSTILSHWMSLLYATGSGADSVNGDDSVLRTSTSTTVA